MIYKKRAEVYSWLATALVLMMFAGAQWTFLNEQYTTVYGGQYKVLILY